MLLRQSIWCQCATIVHVTLMMGCGGSIQRMSLDMDISASVVFMVTSVIHFCSAEHVDTGPITAVVWSKMEKKLEMFILAIVFICALPIQSHVYLAVFIGIVSIVFDYTPFVVTYPIVALTVIYSAPTVMIPMAIVWPLAKIRYEQCFQEINETPFSGNQLKMAYAWKAVFIFTEAFLLWHLRCSRRFPGTFRWRPIIVACLSSIVGCVYCTCYRLPTNVSPNTIIVSSGHQMAASLTAATKCSHCKQHLRSLDMESMFGDDGF